MNRSASDERAIARRGACTTLLGWSAEQWAYAAGHYAIESIDNWSQAEALRRRWHREQRTDPGPGLIELPDYRQHYPKNMRAAWQVFSLVPTA